MLSTCTLAFQKRSWLLAKLMLLQVLSSCFLVRSVLDRVEIKSVVSQLLLNYKCFRMLLELFLRQIYQLVSLVRPSWYKSDCFLNLNPALPSSSNEWVNVFKAFHWTLVINCFWISYPVEPCQTFAINASMYLRTWPIYHHPRTSAVVCEMFLETPVSCLSIGYFVTSWKLNVTV